MSAKIGQRCVFYVAHIYSFGTIIKVFDDGLKVLIQDDEGDVYEKLSCDVTLL